MDVPLNQAPGRDVYICEDCASSAWFELAHEREEAEKEAKKKAKGPAAPPSRPASLRIGIPQSLAGIHRSAGRAGRERCPTRPLSEAAGPAAHSNRGTDVLQHVAGRVRRSP